MLPLQVCPSVEERRGSTRVGGVTGVRALTLPRRPTGSASR
jgi:hypothetical protein